ncbi:MAG: response regulator transcription factor [Elusimicrobia bacterium]|nr:response regulator transcription factor [Elusimicrobiota bacterium]
MADRKHILVADDDPELIELLQMDLIKEGYEVLTASNGKEVLQILNQKAVDLVLLDIMMPYMDGYHVAYEVSTKLGSSAPKILLMTSRDTSREKGVAMLSGATDVIQKPFGLQDLHTKIKEVLK